MTKDRNYIDFGKIDMYKIIVSVILGLISFIGTFYSSRFDFDGFSINFIWSIILPILITISWGIGYGIISITLGLTALYPFFLGTYNGWASIVPAASLYLLIIIHGYGGKKRLEENKFYYNIYFLQFIYIIIRMVIYIIFFPMLVKFNPPFWNPYAYTYIGLDIILVFSIKGIIVESTLVGLCDALLLLPFVRKIFKLECSRATRYNTKIMSALVSFGLGFAFIVLSVNNFIIDKGDPFRWIIEPNEKIRITFLLATILFFIMGGVTVRFVQRMLETQEALRYRETQYKLAIKEIQNLNNELEKRVSDRTAELQSAVLELEEFAYTISHDLKSPLRAIDGYSNFIIEDYGSTLDNEVGEMLSNIQEICRDMIGLINRLLEYSTTSKSDLSKESVSIKHIIEMVFQEFKVGNSEKKIELAFEGEFPILNVDRVLFRQVIANIISNAIKFSKDRDIIKILAGCIIKENQYVFYIKDNGVGFDMKYSAKLFGIFQRLHKSKDFEGYGIGLATIKNILKKHGGKVWIEGILNEGATVYFTLPVEIDVENEG